jgi:hypothetical protein
VDLVADRGPEGSGAEQLEKKSRDQKRSRMETGPHGVSGGGCVVGRVVGWILPAMMSEWYVRGFEEWK